LKSILRGACWGRLQSWREEGVDSGRLRILLLREGTLEACRLWLDWRELVRSRIRKWPTSIVHPVVHAIVHEVLLWHASLHRVLEATILLRARVELIEVLRLLLLILKVLWLLLLVLKAHLWILRTIEASILLLHSHVIQALSRRSNLWLIAS